MSANINAVIHLYTLPLCEPILNSVFENFIQIFASGCQEKGRVDILYSSQGAALERDEKQHLAQYLELLSNNLS